MTAAPTLEAAAPTRLGRARARVVAALAPIPLAIYLLLFFVAPLVFFFRISFYTSAPFGQFGHPLGWQNFAGIVTSDYYQQVLIRTLGLCAYASLGSLVLGYPIAYIIIRFRRAGSVLFIVTAATMLSSTVAMVLGWRVLLSETGPINGFLKSLGLISQPLDLSNNFTAVVIGTTHAVLPIVTIGLMPVVQRVSYEQILAARSLGSSEWRVFRSVFLPQTINGAMGMGLLAFASTAGAFTTPVLLGGGRVGVLSILIYDDATRQLNFPRAAALAVVLFLIVAAIVLALRLLSRTRVVEGTIGQ